jgi:hypothetical protein
MARRASGAVFDAGLSQGAALGGRYQEAAVGRSLLHLSRQGARPPRDVHRPRSRAAHRPHSYRLQPSHGLGRWFDRARRPEAGPHRHRDHGERRRLPHQSEIRRSDHPGRMGAGQAHHRQDEGDPAPRRRDVRGRTPADDLPLRRAGADARRQAHRRALAPISTTGSAASTANCATSRCSTNCSTSRATNSTSPSASRSRGNISTATRRRSPITSAIMSKTSCPTTPTARSSR